jgi:hypothetical protein
MCHAVRKNKYIKHLIKYKINEQAMKSLITNFIEQSLSSEYSVVIS